MSACSKLIIPDADVIIDLHSFGLWDAFVASYDVHVAEQVVEEAQFYRAGTGEQSRGHSIDLKAAISAGKLNLTSIQARDLVPMLKHLKQFQAPEIDPGETETIAIVYAGLVPDLVLCLKDVAAIRCAALLGLAPNLVSVERALDRCGLSRSLTFAYSEKKLQQIVKDAESYRVFHLASGLDE